MPTEDRDLLEARLEIEKWADIYDVGLTDRQYYSLVAALLRARADGIEASAKLDWMDEAPKEMARLRALADREEKL